MPVVLTGLAALAADNIRTALSQCETIQELFGVSDDADPEAAALAMLFISDAGEALPPAYGLITITPRGSDNIASGLRRYSFDFSADFWIPKPDDADLAEEDFLASHNLSEAANELWEMHDNGGLDFELTACASDVVVRDEETGDGAGDMGNVLNGSVECYDG